MHQPPRDSGVTLIEVLVTVALMGVLMAIAVGGYDKWANAEGQSGSARELQSRLRNTQQLAVTRGTAMCVDFDTAHDQYTVFNGACGDALRTKAEGPIELDSGVHLVSPSFAGSTGVTFFPRGTATPGQVQVSRDGSSTIDTLRVSQLTGYVKLDD